MKKAFLFFLMLSSLSGFTEPLKESNILITKDSLHFTFSEAWRFSPNDDPAMSAKDYNDSSWSLRSSFLYMDRLGQETFKGFGWFRIYFTVDSSITGRPMAISIDHLGASEIYFDGKLVRKFGVIGDPGSCQYFDPQQLPVILTIEDTGRHVFAVRYANYEAEKNHKKYNRTMAGFKLILGKADSMIELNDTRSMVLSAILLLLFGIFFALSILHLFLYLYYRTAKSNLYFFIFTMCLSIGVIIGYINIFSHNPVLQLRSQYISIVLISLGCISLSGLIHELYLKKKGWIFFVVVAGGIAVVVFRYLEFRIFAVLAVGLIISVSFQTVFTIIFGIRKKLKGAKIIGAGFLFFTLFIIAIYAAAIFSGGKFDINDSTPMGKIITIIAAMAVLSMPLSMSAYLAWSFSNVNKDLADQLQQVKLLSDQNLQHERDKNQLVSEQNEKLEQKVKERTKELEEEKKKSDDLLLNILPSEVATELKEKGSSGARDYDQVTVMFTDFKDFTRISEALSPAKLVSEIDHCFSAFDNIIHKYGIEKIKTIGDAYMCVGGLPAKNQTHAEDIIRAAMEIRDFMRDYKVKKDAAGEPSFEIRIGIHTGPVVAGIVGIKKFAYDIWGDTVNTASRMENSSEAGKINISSSSYELVKDKFTFTFRGKLDVKSKGLVDMYFVE